MIKFVMFLVDDQRYALPLPAVERIVHAVEVTPLPKAPDIVIGVINVAGDILPVCNLRRRFRLPERNVGAGDQFLIAHTASRMVALVIDEAKGMIECEKSAVIASTRLVPGLEHIQGIVKLDDGLVLIQDLEKFLSMDETRELNEAMSQN